MNQLFRHLHSLSLNNT